MHEKERENVAKERENAANDGWHSESAENAVVHLDENVETIIALEMKKASTVVDGDCA